jgi:spermidine synthase
MTLHLIALFVVAMVCHGELAQQRPAPARLTAFFLCMSLGGVLGGMFNALLAPVIFTRVLEYPIAIVIAAMLLPRTEPQAGSNRAFDVLLPSLLGVLLAAVLLGLNVSSNPESAHPLLRCLPHGLSALLVYLLPILLCFHFAGRPLRFGLGVAAILLASGLTQELQAQILYRERGFFGDLHLRVDASNRYLKMLHGTTVHGMQSLDPKHRREPLTYFHHDGPIGQLFASLQDGDAPQRVAVIGLGVGTLASYADQGQDWTYYEIDMAVTRVADDPKYFTYLSDARERGVYLRVVHGDARLQLKKAGKREYDLLVLDAFSSDSVPVHLLTREAIELYLTKLAPNGRLVFNISNRYLRLEPVVAAGIADAKLHALIKHDIAPAESIDRYSSSWVVMARDAATLEQLARQPGWRTLRQEPHVRMWKDDYSNILSIFLW